MTQGSNQTDLLRRAASMLRERTEKATPGPWGDPIDVNYGDFGWYVSGSPAGETADSEIGRADATYIATMHPGVGLAFAGWLEATADEIRRRGVTARLKVSERAAVEAAREVLGVDAK